MLPIHEIKLKISAKMLDFDYHPLGAKTLKFENIGQDIQKEWSR